MNPLLRRSLLSCLAAFAAAHGCSAATIAARSPVSVPTAIFPALCTTFVEQEEIDASTTTVVLKETRPVFNTFALRILHEAGEMTPAEADQDDARDKALEDGFVPTRVELPEGGGPCQWRSADRPLADYFGTTTLVLELSNVVEDPFARGGETRYGLFARLSNGGDFGASWYWVALKQIGTSWGVAAVSRLDISDG